MASKVFLDANILLDLTLKRKGYNEAKEIFNLAVNSYIKIYITSSIVTITGHWLTKAYGASKAKEILLTLLIDVSVIDTPHEIVLMALHSKINDIEDSLQYYTAIENKLDYFISRDIKLKKESIPALPVVSPLELLKEFNTTNL